LAAAKAEETRLVAEEAYARTVHEQEKAIYKQEATTNRKYVEAVQKSKRLRRPWIAPKRRSARPSRRWRRGSAKNTLWSLRSRRGSPRPDSNWNGRACPPD